MDSFFQRVSSLIIRTSSRIFDQAIDDEHRLEQAENWLRYSDTRRRSAPDIERHYRTGRRTTLKGISDEQIATRFSRLNSLGKLRHTSSAFVIENASTVTFEEDESKNSE